MHMGYYIITDGIVVILIGNLKILPHQIAII